LLRGTRDTSVHKFYNSHTMHMQRTSKQRRIAKQLQPGDEKFSQNEYQIKASCKKSRDDRSYQVSQVQNKKLLMSDIGTLEVSSEVT